MSIPKEIFIIVSASLIGNVYEKMRAVALKASNNSIVLRIYVNGEVDDFDQEIGDLICSEILSHTSSNNEIGSLDLEIIPSYGDIRDLDPLSGFIFRRMK